MSFQSSGNRRIIYTTNLIIEAVYRQLRKLTKTKGGFPNDDSEISNCGQIGQLVQILEASEIEILLSIPRRNTQQLTRDQTAADHLAAIQIVRACAADDRAICCVDFAWLLGEIQGEIMRISQQLCNLNRIVDNGQYCRPIWTYCGLTRRGR